MTSCITHMTSYISLFLVSHTGHYTLSSHESYISLVSLIWNRIFSYSWSHTHDIAHFPIAGTTHMTSYMFLVSLIWNRIFSYSWSHTHDIAHFPIAGTTHMTSYMFLVSLIWNRIFSYSWCHTHGIVQFPILSLKQRTSFNSILFPSYHQNTKITSKH